MTVDELQVLITANTTQLKKEIQSVQSHLNGIAKNTNKFSTSMTRSFLKSSLIMKAVSTGIRAIGSNLDNAIQRADTINNFSIVMSNLGVSTDDANIAIKKLSDKLTGLPTTLDSAVVAVQRFTSANGNVKASTDMFLALNNAILASGANTQIQASALEQLSQAYAKGKPDMMEWRTAMTAMPAQLKQVAVAMGYANASQLGEELRNGRVSMNEFMQTIHKLNTEGVNGFASFEKQAKGAIGGIKTSITNVKTAITRGIADIINSIGRANIAGFFQNVAKAINNAIPYITAFVKACIWAINSVSKLFGGKNIIDTNSTAKAVNNVNNSVKNLDQNNKNAVGSAQKINKELKKLAGFDEMNVLTDNSSDSGSGSTEGDMGSGANFDAGGLDTSTWDTGLDSMSGKTDALVEKMKNLLKLVGAVGTALLAWKISKTVLDFFINPGNLGFFKMMGDLFGVGDVLNALTTSDKLMSLGGAISAVAGIVALAYGVFDAWINGLDWGNMALMLGGVTAAAVGLYFAIKPFSAKLASMVAGITAVAGGVALLVVGVKDFIANGPTLQNTIMIIGGAIAIAVGLATAGLSLLVSAIVGAVAAISAFIAAIILEEPAIMSVAEAQNNLTEAKERAKAAEDSYISSVDAAEAAMKKLEEAEKQAGVTGAELYAQVQSGTLDYADMTDAQKEVYKAYLDNEKKQADLKAATEDLNAAKKAETIASYENQLALAKESGSYDEFKQSVIDAFEQGELSADEARELISKSMSEMSNDAQQTFMKDLPNSIKDGLDPHKYESTGTKIKKWFGNLWDGIKNVFGDIGDWFNSVGEKIGNAVAKGAKSAVNWFLEKAINTINGFFKGINWAIGIINKIPGVEIKKIDLLEVPKLARGGIIDRPTVAMVGEAGKEAVMPLERNTGWIDQLAVKLGDKMSGGGSNIKLIVKLGEDAIFDKFIEYSREKSFETNGEVVFA